ncbi:MAG: hypothetical protein H6739_13675 [Alphaproteobacteria bacterium]|nr:hypothetical protein [Alphaproteobacteria bacterium]
MWLLLLVLACRNKDDVVDTGPIDGDGDGLFGEADCNDDDPAAGGIEVPYDGVDNDCDPSTPDDDLDGDGYAQADDCDDSDANLHPGAVELCDGVDQDCDGVIDDAESGAWYVDADGDGFGDPETEQASCDGEGLTADGSDCDDADPAINIAADELCDGIDNDCDGAVDEPSAADAADWYADVDGDGFGSTERQRACEAPEGYVALSTDCDDADPAVNPDATEVCDGVDNDCDGQTDDDASVDAPSWYPDADADGYGDGRAELVACTQPSGTADNADDCDDDEPTVHPGAAEACDDLDNDCDLTVDEGVLTTFYLDYDADGYGDDARAVEGCAALAGYVSAGGDCDDTDTAYNPGAAAGCDGEDYDCDGLVDNDSDGDGASDSACGGTDCDDADASLTLCGSCLEILNTSASATDGSYDIDPDGDGVSDTVLCDMTTDGGGWMQLVDDDYSADPCPGNWVQDAAQGVCHRDTARGSDVSAIFDAHGVTWDEARGAMTAYQYASTNAFWYASGTTLDDWYVDGVSITHGASTRAHVFTYAVGYSISQGYVYDCPAIGGNPAPLYVGSDFLCESGNSGTTFAYVWYTPLLFANDTFQVTLASPTTDDVEVRIMCDEESSSHSYSEDVGVASLELWVR